MYERILEYFHTMGNALLDVSSMEKSASESIAKQADMVSYSNNQIFVHVCLLQNKHAIQLVNKLTL